MTAPYLVGTALDYEYARKALNFIRPARYIVTVNGDNERIMGCRDLEDFIKEGFSKDAGAFSISVGKLDGKNRVVEIKQVLEV